MITSTLRANTSHNNIGLVCSTSVAISKVEDAICIAAYFSLCPTGTSWSITKTQMHAAEVGVQPTNSANFKPQTSIYKNFELKKMYYYKISFSYISLHAQKKPVEHDRAHLAHNLTTKSSLDKKIKAAGNAAFIFYGWRILQQPLQEVVYVTLDTVFQPFVVGSLNKRFANNIFV
jgi:hypothetical protein